MNESKNVKALKKQLAAAIAMVCVAAVALGSSTYAWFVTNNKVDATTSTISAQSNAAYMTIANGTSGASSVDTTSVTTTVATKPLYPATFGEEQGATKGKFMTGYGTDLNDGSLKGNLKLVGTEGSYSDATGADYALQQDFNISSKGQNLAKLSIDKIEDKSAQTSGLKMPLRVLVTNDAGTVWEVYGKDAAGTAYERKLTSADGNAAVDFGNVTAGTDTPLHVYLYYEGGDTTAEANTSVNTENLQNGQLVATNAVTVYFTAEANTSVNHVFSTVVAWRAYQRAERFLLFDML